jgi:hypothetical protein
MKKILLSLLFLYITFPTSGQNSGGPDAFGYTWRNSNDSLGPNYSWIDITTMPGAVQVTGLTDDNTSNFFPIGFQFPYYWYTVSDFKVGSNGYIIFNNGAIASPYPAIPSTALPNNYLAAMMCDLNFGGTPNNAQCWYWSNLIDTLIVSFINVPFWQNAFPPLTGLNTFQMILSAADSSITYQYALQQGTSAATTGVLTIGIENISGAVGLMHSQNTYPPQSHAIKFYYPDSSTFSVKDAAVVYNNNPETGGLFLSKDGAPFAMSAQIKNTGTQTINPFDVYMYLLSSTGSVMAQDTLQTDTLLPGQTQDISSPNLFTPSATDTYTFMTSTQLSGDATPTNNDKAMEIVVVDTTQGLIALSYTGNTASPPSTGISWTGGDAGMGVEFVPPFLPCYIHRVEFFITANLQASDFIALIYDNTGPNGGPGALIDSIYIPTTQILVPDQWNIVTLPTPMLVDSGTIFVEWRMNGEGVTIGTDDVQPVSNRTYEIHGAWAIYRSRENEDVMIRTVVSASNQTAVSPLPANVELGEFYPSPADNIIYINTGSLQNSGSMLFSFYNLNGQLVSEKRMSKNVLNQHLCAFDVSEFTPGVYICKITSGNQQYNRKLIIKK